MSAGRRSGPRPADDARLADAAHDLRSSLNGIRSWASVLEARLGGTQDAVVRRALQGIHIAVAHQLDVIENQLEAGAVIPPLRRPAMSKRNDAQPEIPDDTPHRERPMRPGPSGKPEAPDGSDAAQAEQDAPRD